MNSVSKLLTVCDSNLVVSPELTPLAHYTDILIPGENVHIHMCCKTVTW